MKLQPFPSLHGYEKSWLRRDVIAGLTLRPEQGVVVLRVEACHFFANAEHVRAGCAHWSRAARRAAVTSGAARG